MGSTRKAYAKYNNLKIVYLGLGGVYSIKGNKQPMGLVGHFWVYKWNYVSRKEKHKLDITWIRKKYGLKA